MDDSSGVVGEAFREGSRLWLVAAAKCRRPRDWKMLFQERVAANDYGIRDPLVPNAAILFSEAELRAMAAEYLAKAHRPAFGRRNDEESFTASVVASQLGVALRDPKLYEKATANRRGSLNDLQRLGVTKRYLEFGDPEGALKHLSIMKEPNEPECLELAAECHAALGSIDEQVRVLKKLFAQTLSTAAFKQIQGLRPNEADATLAWAVTLARRFRNACAAVTFLFEAGCAEEGEALAVSRAEQLADAFYRNLLELVALAKKARRPLVEEVCYRHLIRDILNDARAKAYGHAARHMRMLEGLESSIPGYGSLGEHAAFLAELRQKHGRKSAFWRRVDPRRAS